MSGARKVSYFLVAYVISFVLILMTPSFRHRRDFDLAFFAYYKDPSPENESALRYQQRMNEYFDLKFAAVGVFIVVAFGYGTHVVVQLVDYGLKRIRGSNSQS
jgi:hypothetical protein